jgi:hypothetical protein
METSIKAEYDNRIKNDRRGTPAFKLRVALPGSIGERVTAKVQSLRTLPDQHLMGQEDVGKAVAPPGATGWPRHEVVVTLRRIGDHGTDEHGRFATVYNLYESEETILTLADPRASSDYILQSYDGGIANEFAQCRRCSRPSFLAGEESVAELLVSGPYLRAFLFAENACAPDDAGCSQTKSDTEAAISFFGEQGDSYRAPWGLTEVVQWTGMVGSPYQVSGAVPPLNWARAGNVNLVSGETIMTSIDHHVPGREIDFMIDRTYHSGVIGGSPLGSAGWGSSLFAGMREITTTGEVTYVDGQGNANRFYEGPEPTGEDPEGDYYAVEGAYDSQKAGDYAARKDI